jgi:hypothetical protein
LAAQLRRSIVEQSRVLPLASVRFGGRLRPGHGFLHAPVALPPTDLC